VCAAEKAAAIADHETAALFALLPDAGRVVLAVSGGADSTALLVLAARWRSDRAHGPELIAATVDHRLRTAAHREAEVVAALAQRLGMRHEILTWDGNKPKSGIEAAARTARYRLLAAFARHVNADAVVTAHTLDDQAETVLMRLAAGSGPAGLAGMRPKDTRDGMTLLRPFLRTRKRRLVATLERDGIAWSEDPMNADATFARPRLRATRAALAREGLTPERIARLAGRIARHEEVVAAAVDAARDTLRRSDAPGWFDGRALAAAPEELALRLLAAEIEAIAPANRAAKPLRLQRLETLWSDLSAAVAAGRACQRTLAGALIAVRSDGTLLVSQAPPRRNPAKDPFMNSE